MLDSTLTLCRGLANSPAGSARALRFLQLAMLQGALQTWRAIRPASIFTTPEQRAGAQVEFSRFLLAQSSARAVLARLEHVLTTPEERIRAAARLGEATARLMLVPVANVFCPTGPGGGIDATCSPSASGASTDTSTSHPADDTHAKVLTAGAGVARAADRVALMKGRHSQVAARYAKGEASITELEESRAHLERATRVHQETQARDMPAVLAALKPPHPGPDVTHQWQGAAKPTKPMSLATDKGLVFVKSVLGQKASENLSGLHVDFRRSDAMGRPCCFDSLEAGDGRAVIHQIKGASDHPNITVHELGHALEAHLPGAREACAAFLERRCGKETPTDMREKFGSAFSPGEKGRADDFAKVFDADRSAAYYVGKKYDHPASEVLSMGMEMLHKDPVRFARVDPDYFRLVVGILHGHGR